MGDPLESRAADSTSLRTSLAIAGAIKSGKTSLAMLVAQRMRAPHASFGDEVRRRAAAEGLDQTDRRVLQDLGERIVREEPEDFTDAVIAAARPKRVSGQAIVLDGLRHLRILRALRERLSDTGVTLVYLDATFATREARARAQSVGSDALVAADTHKSESEGRWLRSEADLVFSAWVDINAIADLLVAQLS